MIRELPEVGNLSKVGELSKIENCLMLGNCLRWGNCLWWEKWGDAVVSSGKGSKDLSHGMSE